MSTSMAGSIRVALIILHYGRCLQGRSDLQFRGFPDSKVWRKHQATKPGVLLKSHIVCSCSSSWLMLRYRRCRLRLLFRRCSALPSTSACWTITCSICIGLMNLVLFSEHQSHRYLELMWQNLGYCKRSPGWSAGADVGVGLCIAGREC